MNYLHWFRSPSFLLVVILLFSFHPSFKFILLLFDIYLRWFGVIYSPASMAFSSSLTFCIKRFEGNKRSKQRKKDRETGDSFENIIIEICDLSWGALLSALIIVASIVICCVLFAWNKCEQYNKMCAARCKYYRCIKNSLLFLLSRSKQRAQCICRNKCGATEQIASNSFFVMEFWCRSKFALIVFFGMCLPGCIEWVCLILYGVLYVDLATYQRVTHEFSHDFSNNNKK